MNLSSVTMSDNLPLIEVADFWLQFKVERSDLVLLTESGMNFGVTESNGFL